jgi:hypothetical protein
MTREEFLRLAAEGYNRIPLSVEAFADLETPLSLYLKLAHTSAASPGAEPGANSFLLESVVGGERFGRYSFIGLPARTLLRASGFGAQAKTEVVTDGRVVETAPGNPLDFIAAYQQRFKVAIKPGMPRFCGGLAGYFGYDAVRYIEKKLEASCPPDDVCTPDILLLQCEVGDMVGVVTGLAWTEVGGDILYIESVLTPGKGKVSLTGNLGEVMKESATIAHEWVMAHHKELGIDPEMFEKNDINIHVPEGAIPKDGPSAGITMVTSIVSTYTGRKVRERIAMTGETTLRGRVMPVGGIKEKILAAKRAGIKELILSEDNRKDISEIKAEYIDGLTFHYVRTNEDVLRLALEEKK